MVNNSGHIYAPVSVDDIASVLGESSRDVGALCLSDKINPHSLIRPSYCLLPEIGPEHFENGLVAGTTPTNGTNYWYARKKWGYYVPYVSIDADIKNVYTRPWIHDDPTEDSFFCVAHFDGYLHNATPTLPVSVYAIAGQKIVMNLNVGNAQTDILSPTAIGNNGGVVAIPEVLGAVRIGCTIFRGNQRLGAFVSPNVISTDSNNEIVALETTITAQSNTTYTIIPWATNKNIGEAGAEFYSLKFSEDFDGFIEVYIPTTVVAITKVVVTSTAGMLSFETTIRNQFSTQRTVNNFRLVARSNSGVETETLSNPSSIIIPADDSVTVTFTTTKSSIVNGYNNGTLLSLVLQATCNGETLTSTELIRVQKPPLIIE